MKIILILASFVMLTIAKPQYGAPGGGLAGLDIAQLLRLVNMQMGFVGRSHRQASSYGPPPSQAYQMHQQQSAGGYQQQQQQGSSGYQQQATRSHYQAPTPNFSGQMFQQQSQPQSQYGSPQQQQPQQGYSQPQAQRAPDFQRAPAQPQYSAPQQAIQQASFSSNQYSAPAQTQSSGGYQQQQQQQQSGGYQQQQQQQQQSQGGYGGQREQEQQQTIHKHVYVHIAPEEPTTPRPQKKYTPAPKPEKHYKILFIKAPETRTEAPEIPELPPLPEQKTLVYVLLKNPEPTQPIEFPTQAPTKPTKPEVYFIRYKSPENQQQQYGAPAQESNQQSSSGPIPNSAGYQ